MAPQVSSFCRLGNLSMMRPRARQGGAKDRSAASWFWRHQEQVWRVWRAHSGPTSAMICARVYGSLRSVPELQRIGAQRRGQDGMRRGEGSSTSSSLGLFCSPFGGNRGERRAQERRGGVGGKEWVEQKCAFRRISGGRESQLLSGAGLSSGCNAKSLLSGTCDCGPGTRKDRSGGSGCRASYDIRNESVIGEKPPPPPPPFAEQCLCDEERTESWPSHTLGLGRLQNSLEKLASSLFGTARRLPEAMGVLGEDSDIFRNLEERTSTGQQAQRARTSGIQMESIRTPEEEDCLAALRSQTTGRSTSGHIATRE